MQRQIDVSDIDYPYKIKYYPLKTKGAIYLNRQEKNYNKKGAERPP